MTMVQSQNPKSWGQFPEFGRKCSRNDRDYDSDLLTRMPTAFMACMCAHDVAPFATNDVVGSSNSRTDARRHSRSHVDQSFVVRK
jgi:hypothetical protein